MDCGSMHHHENYTKMNYGMRMKYYNHFSSMMFERVMIVFAAYVAS